MIKRKVCAIIIVILMFLALVLNLLQPVKASSNSWSETWHSGIYENYPGYRQNISTTKTVYSTCGNYWIKIGLVVSVYQYQPWLNHDAVFLMLGLYFDSFANEGLPTPLPVAAQHVSFAIEKDAGGSNLNDQWLSVVQTETPPGCSQGYGLIQYTSTGANYPDKTWWALTTLGHAVGLFFEPVGVAMGLIDLAYAFAPGGGADFDNAEWYETEAGIWWFNPGFDFGEENPVRQYAFSTIRWVQNYSVNPDSYYGIKVRANIELPAPSPFQSSFIETSSLNLRIYHKGGGAPDPCPILSVYDGVEYVEEGLLDIHNPDCIDEVASHVLTVTPEAVEHRYLMRLTEHPQTHSYIDQVQLFATLKTGTEIRLPLISAIHSTDGNVRLKLLFSDDIRTDILGADHNNGTSEYIDLKFWAPRRLQIEEFTFIIEGYNPLFKE